MLTWLCLLSEDVDHSYIWLSGSTYAASIIFYFYFERDDGASLADNAGCHRACVGSQRKWFNLDYAFMLNKKKRNECIRGRTISFILLVQFLLDTVSCPFPPVTQIMQVSGRGTRCGMAWGAEAAGEQNRRTPQRRGARAEDTCTGTSLAVFFFSSFSICFSSFAYNFTPDSIAKVLHVTLL